MLATYLIILLSDLFTSTQITPISHFAIPVLHTSCTSSIKKTQSSVVQVQSKCIPRKTQKQVVPRQHIPLQTMTLQRHPIRPSCLTTPLKLSIWTNEYPNIILKLSKKYFLVLQATQLQSQITIATTMEFFYYRQLISDERRLIAVTRNLAINGRRLNQQCETTLHR